MSARVSFRYIEDRSACSTNCREDSRVLSSVLLKLDREETSNYLIFDLYSQKSVLLSNSTILRY